MIHCLAEFDASRIELGLSDERLEDACNLLRAYPDNGVLLAEMPLVAGSGKTISVASYAFEWPTEVGIVELAHLNIAGVASYFLAARDVNGPEFDRGKIRLAVLETALAVAFIL